MFKCVVLYGDISTCKMCFPFKSQSIDSHSINAVFESRGSIPKGVVSRARTTSAMPRPTPHAKTSTYTVLMKLLLSGIFVWRNPPAAYWVVRFGTLQVHPTSFAGPPGCVRKHSSGFSVFPRPRPNIHVDILARRSVLLISICTGSIYYGGNAADGPFMTMYFYSQDYVTWRQGPTLTLYPYSIS